MRRLDALLRVAIFVVDRVSAVPVVDSHGAFVELVAPWVVTPVPCSDLVALAKDMRTCSFPRPTAAAVAATTTTLKTLKEIDNLFDIGYNETRLVTLVCGKGQGQGQVRVGVRVRLVWV